MVILKVDGMGQDMLANAIAERDPASGKSQLPWLSRIFVEQGAVYENFYTRGISLSAPSWSMLDTGHHTVIRGNVDSLVKLVAALSSAGIEIIGDGVASGRGVRLAIRPPAP